MSVKEYNVPEGLYYTRDHEWIKVEDNGVHALVGITDYAQHQLGDIVYVDVPSVGEELSQGDVFGAVEAVKTVADLFLPASGRVLEVNPRLEAQPTLVNKDPYGEGWIIRVEIKDTGELNNLLSAEEYRQLIGVGEPSS